VGYIREAAGRRERPKYKWKSSSSGGAIKEMFGARL